MAGLFCNQTSRIPPKLEVVAGLAIETETPQDEPAAEQQGSQGDEACFKFAASPPRMRPNR